MDYNDLPPMTPGGLPLEEPQPARASAPSPSQQYQNPTEDFDDIDLDADEPDDSDESLDSSGEVPDTKAPDGSPEARIAALEAQLQARQDEIEALNQWREYASEQQRIQQENHAKQYWETAQQEAENWYRTRSAQIYAEADQAMAPVAYLREQMGILDNQWRQWLNHFHTQREQAYWEFAMQQSMPNMAAEVAEQYNLTKDAIAEIMQYPMEMWDREAQRIKRERDERAKLKRQATQAKRRAEKEIAMRDGVYTGDGGAGGRKDVAPDSDEYYMSIPWQVVRPR